MNSSYYNEMQKLMSESRQSEALFDVEKTCSEMLNFLAVIQYDTCPEYFEKALEYLKMGLKIDPGNWMLHSNMAHILHERGLPEKALVHALASLEDGLEQGDAFYNAGVILACLKEHKQAIEMYRKSLKLDPNKKIVAFNMGSELLAQGEFKEGWDLYENRLEVFDTIKNVTKQFSAPKWNGQKGKKIVIYSEQGAGDFIQFCRYIPKITKKFDVVVLEVQKGLTSLISRNFDVEVIGVENSVFPEPEGCDFSIPVCSLPRLFKATDKNSKVGKYLTAPQRDVVPKELDTPKKKIGVAFAGSYAHRQDHLRSCKLNMFRPISELKNIQLYSLQKDNDFVRMWRGKEVNLLEGMQGMNILDLGGYLNDYDDLAFLLEQLDLIITVDTSAAHLAAALGKPVWLLLPYNCDFRWKTKGVSSYWYKTIKIFRQSKRNDWEGLFDKVKQELLKVQNSL